MMTLKPRLLTLIFALLCFKKSFLMNNDEEKSIEMNEPPLKLMEQKVAVRSSLENLHRRQY